MTKIEWASLGLPNKGVTWNPIRARDKATGKQGWHCEHVSEACRNCYAERLNMKPGATGGTGAPYKPGHAKDIEIYLDEKTLLAPLKWKSPRGVFPCSMTDIFGSWVPDEWLDRIFAIMALCPQHRFAVLTKRPARMREWVEGNSYRAPSMPDLLCEEIGKISGRDPRESLSSDVANWPLPNVMLGVTAEDQQRADERIPDLLATLAAVRFVSIEPMLAPVDLTRIRPDMTMTLNALTGDAEHLLGMKDRAPRLDWAICGGESGPGARPMHPDWARSLRDQCKAAGVAFFFKQRGEWSWPEDPMSPTFDERNETTSELPIDWRERDCGVVCMSRDGSRCDGYGGRGEEFLFRVGKSRAGRLLDGVEHSAFPEARS